ncbi:hypothetical protein PIB30_047740 [Stylosanthes scabra]|uniref:Uncharacterized protein n=1 Tax=Stylosanthes scabra TaxID=79078 RepID=A0ABU6YE58_9FABA|nr:hypothetical protein [Stylosanthes scabra]
MAVLLKLIACPKLEFFLWDGSRVSLASSTPMLSLIPVFFITRMIIVHHPLLPDRSLRADYVEMQEVTEMIGLQ